MFLSKWSVQRPIAMTAFIIVLVMIGISLYPKISIDLLPNMEIRKSRLKLPNASRMRSPRWTASSM